MSTQTTAPSALDLIDAAEQRAKRAELRAERLQRTLKGITAIAHAENRFQLNIHFAMDDIRSLLAQAAAERGDPR